MNTRLSKILKDKQLNPKQFAISCGIQIWRNSKTHAW